MVRPDIILTGPARSGTTLTCHLLNKLPSVVALHEPMRPREWRALDGPGAVCRAIEAFFADMRSSIRSRGLAMSKHFNGEVPDNIRGGSSPAGLRQSGLKLGEISIGKPLAPDFLLAVKHVAEFTALLEHLVRRFPCYAVIRNPLSVLASWNSADMPVEAGHVPSAEGVDPQLRDALEHIRDKTARQLYLLSWHFEIYQRVLNAGSVLRYEDIIQSRGKALRVIAPASEALDESLVSKNQNEIYSAEAVLKLGEALLDSDGAYWNFYSKESVREVMDGFRQRRAGRRAVTGPMPVCITGMHRSGTSMVARLLHDCGLYLGEERELLPATSHNEDGHWEHKKFVDISEEFLAAFGGGWDCPPEIPADWACRPAIQETLVTANALLQKFTGYPMWGWKDPRACLTLPLWNELLPDAKRVICLRHPMEVAHSLRRRGSMSNALSFRLWLAYNERLLEATRPEQRLITHYGNYFRDPRAELRRVLDFVKLPMTDEALDAVLARVQPRLRHHRFAAGLLAGSSLETAVLSLYRKMCTEACWQEDEAGAIAPSRPVSLLQYQELLGRIRAAAAQVLPGSATVIVASKGDDALLQLSCRSAWHFPQNADGVYAGYSPANTAEIVEALGNLCSKGGEYFLLPQTAFWWLDYYEGLRGYLDSHGGRVWNSEDCAIYRLCEPANGDASDGDTMRKAATAESLPSAAEAKA